MNSSQTGEVALNAAIGQVEDVTTSLKSCWAAMSFYAATMDGSSLKEELKKLEGYRAQLAHAKCNLDTVKNTMSRLQTTHARKIEALQSDCGRLQREVAALEDDIQNLSFSEALHMVDGAEEFGEGYGGGSETRKREMNEREWSCI